MKYIPSVAFEEMSGSAKGVTAAKVRSRKYIRNKGTGGSVRTSYQSSVKSIFKQLSQSWKSLTNARILAWNALALSQAGKRILGTSAKLTGSNIYMCLNYWIVYCGGTAVANPPTLEGVEAPADATLSLSTSAMSLQLASIPASVSNIKLIIQASVPQSNGVTRAYSKAAAFAAPYLLYPLRLTSRPLMTPRTALLPLPLRRSSSSGSTSTPSSVKSQAK